MSHADKPSWAICYELRCDLRRLGFGPTPMIWDEKTQRHGFGLTWSHSLGRVSVECADNSVAFVEHTCLGSNAAAFAEGSAKLAQQARSELRASGSMYEHPAWAGLL